MIEGGERHITQIQILSHQSKISTKVEIFVGNGDDYNSCSFKRLGYLSLDNNERSSFQARELKTVYVDCIGSFMRLHIHTCFPNKHNLFSQVGIVAVNLLGTDDLDLVKRNVPNPLRLLANDTGLDAHTKKKLSYLADAKARAVSSEDYKLAKQIKVVEEDLKEVGTKLALLEIEKKKAIQEEDYDYADEIKIKTDQFHSEIEKKVRP